MRNLLGRLIDRSPESLAGIARFWEIDLRGRNAHQDAGHLYRVMVDPWALGIVWPRLDDRERAVVRLLTGDGRTLTAAEIAARLPGDPADDVLPVLRSLYRAGLLFQEQAEPVAGQAAEPRFFLPRELAHVVKRLDADRARGMPDADPVPALLDRLDDIELAAVAQHLGYRVIPAVAMRADLVAYVTPRLTDPDIIRNSVRALDPIAARLWSWLLAQPGPAPPEAAQAALGYSQRELRQGCRALARRGLLWRGYTPDGDLRLVVPEAVRNPRRPPPAPPPELVGVPAEEVEVPEWVLPHAAAWDLLTLLRAQAEDGRLVRQGGGDPNPTAVRRLAPALWRRAGDLPPTGYIPFLAYLGQALGLLGADGQPGDRAALRAWTRRTFAEQSRALVGIWREAASWPEGAGREVLQVWGADWPGFRAALLAALGEIAGGEWYTLESFAARFAARTPAALGAHFTAAASHEGVAESPEARRLEVVKLAAETTLTTAGVWLGLIELGRAHRRGLALRVAPEGAWLLDEASEPPQEPALGAAALAVQPSFEVLLLRPSPRHVWALTMFAELVRLDRASVYRLTKTSIERGLAAGLTPHWITGFLERQSGAPLPQPVAYQITEWVRAYRRVRLLRAVVVEPDDRGRLGAIGEALDAAGLRVEPLPGERLLVLLPRDDADGAARLEEILREQGQTPQWLGG